jgi:hypothetical protein
VKQHDQAEEEAVTIKRAPSGSGLTDPEIATDISSRKFDASNAPAPLGEGQGQAIKLTQGFVDLEIDVILDALLGQWPKRTHRLPINTENVRVLQERYIRMWDGIARRRPLSKYGLPSNVDALVVLHARLARVVRRLPDVHPPVEPALHAALSALVDEVRIAAHRKIEQAARDLEHPPLQPDDEFEPEP